MKKTLSAIAFLSAVILMTIGCSNSTENNENFADDLQKQLIQAEEGAVIEIPAGTFEFTRPLSFQDVPNVTIKGAGKQKTILSFKGQIEGGEGLIVKAADGITLQGFTVQDSKGDAIKVQGCKNVTLRDLETTWTTGKSEQNGGYGLYPVTCTNVLMEDCEASYAMDAGIYVGQSINVVVRNNLAHNNVAGIEIENTINAEVYGNTARENSGGLMIFDMPDLPQANGANVVVHDNIVENNNGENFSTPGIAVSMLPPGTGFLIMAHRNIEIYNNKVTGHNTVSFAVNSWQFTGRAFKSEEFDPFCHSINVHDNEVVLGTAASDTTTDFGKLFSSITQGQPTGIAIDGIFNPAHLDSKGALKPEHAISFRNNGEIPFMNLNAAKAMGENGLDVAKLAKVISMDASVFSSEMEAMKLEGHDTWLTK